MYDCYAYEPNGRKCGKKIFVSLGYQKLLKGVRKYTFYFFAKNTKTRLGATKTAPIRWAKKSGNSLVFRGYFLIFSFCIFFVLAMEFKGKLELKNLDLACVIFDNYFTSSFY